MADSHKRRVLVIGGTGTVGSNLLKELQKDTETLDIVAAARSPKSVEAVRALGHETVHLDLSVPSTLLPAMAGTHTLFMLKPYGIDYLIQSKIIIDAAVKARTKHIVNLGSHGNDDTIWASIGWNRLVEAYLKVSGIAATTLRPNYFMNNVAPRTNRQTGEIIHYFGGTAVSWIAAEDIARVAAAVIRDPAPHAGRAYPLAAEARSMAEIAEILGDVLGRHFTVKHIPREEAYAKLTALGWDGNFAKSFTDFMHGIANGEVEEVGQVFETVTALTGRPALSWRDFAALHRYDFQEV